MKTGKQEKSGIGKVKASRTKWDKQPYLHIPTSLFLQKTMGQWSTGAQFCRAFHIQGGLHIALITIEMH